MDDTFHFDLTAECGHCWDNDEEWIGMSVELDADSEQIVATCPRCKNSVYLSYDMGTEDTTSGL